MRITYCPVCGRKHSVDREIVGYMQVRYFTVCLNTQCDECYVEVETISESDAEWEPSENQIQSMMRPV